MQVWYSKSSGKEDDRAIQAVTWTTLETVSLWLRPTGFEVSVGDGWLLQTRFPWHEWGARSDARVARHESAQVCLRRCTPFLGPHQWSVSRFGLPSCPLPDSQWCGGAWFKGEEHFISRHHWTISLESVNFPWPWQTFYWTDAYCDEYFKFPNLKVLIEHTFIGMALDHSSSLQGKPSCSLSNGLGPVFCLAQHLWV